MSFTRIQGTGSATIAITSASLAFGSNVTSGNLITVAVTAAGASSLPTVAISDTQLNTYTLDKYNDSSYGVTNGYAVVSIYRTLATSSSALTISISTNISTNITMSIAEWSYSSGIVVVDATGSGFDNSGLASPQTHLPLALSGDDLIIACIDIGNSTGLTYTAGSSFTIDYSNNTVGTRPFISEYDINETSSSITPTLTVSSPVKWTIVAVAYYVVTAVVNKYDSDSGTSLEGIYLEATIPVAISSDVSYATDQQTVLNSTILSDQSQSYDNYISSGYIYSKDLSFADQANDPVMSTPATITVQSSDFSIALESQSTHNVIQNFDADSAFASESQFVIGQFFYDTDTPSASESQFPEIIAGDFSLAIDLQVFSSSIFYSSDSAIASETQQITIAGGSSGTVFDKNPTVGLEAWLRIIRIGDLAIGRENSAIATTIITSGTADTSIGLESQLPIRFSYESPFAQESYYYLSRIIIVDSGVSQSAFIFSNLVIQTDFAKSIEASILSRSLILIGSGIIDSVTGMEVALPIRLPSDDSATGNEYQNKFILGSSSTTDSATGIETNLKIIFSLEHPIATDKQFLSYSTMSSSSAGASSAIGQETQLTIFIGSESPVAIDQQFKILLDINTSFATDKQTVFNFSILSGSGFVDSAIASEAFLRIMLAGEFGFSVNASDTSTGQIYVPQPSTTSITDVLNALLIYLNSTGVVGPASIDMVIDPDSVTLWPTSPGAILLIEPLDLTDAGDDIGGGRYSKVWNWNIKIHVILDNIFDSSFKDIFLSESHDYTSGPFQLAYQVQILLEQAYLVNSFYQPVLIEFPYFLRTEKPRRYKGSNNYIGMPLFFSVVFRDNLPSLNIP